MRSIRLLNDDLSMTNVDIPDKPVAKLIIVPGTDGVTPDRYYIRGTGENAGLAVQCDPYFVGDCEEDERCQYCKDHGILNCRHIGM